MVNLQVRRQERSKVPVRKLSIQGRLYALVGAMVVFLSALLVFLGVSTGEVNDHALDELSAVMILGHQEKLKVAVHSLAVTLGHGLAGTTDREQQGELVKRLTADLRFEKDGSGYFFAY